jgi:hypothetical protein
VGVGVVLVVLVERVVLVEVVDGVVEVVVEVVELVVDVVEEDVDELVVVVVVGGGGLVPDEPMAMTMFLLDHIDSPISECGPLEFGKSSCCGERDGHHNAVDWHSLECQ